MTKLTIKIDENISLTGTIVTEEDGTEEYDLYYYQPECPFGANCEYTGNVLLPMEPTVAGNIAPPVPPMRRPKAELNQWYNRSMTLGGNLTVNGNIDTLGCYNGVGSLTSITMLPETQPIPTTMWSGRKGEIAIHKDYIYLCVEPYTWIRWSIEKTW